MIKAIKTPLVEEFEINRLKVNKKMLGKQIEVFKKRMESNKNFNITLFNLKLPTLVTGKYNYKLMKEHESVGLFLASENKIFVYNKCSKLTIYHELFHFSSTIIDYKNKFIGFYQNYDNKKIGLKLNEGYTSLLVHKYFDAPIEKSGYRDEIYFAKYLEKIIGSKMEALYFNSNLYDLINELKKHNTEDNIYKFIHNMDKYKHNKNKYRLEIFDFLINTYKNKCKKNFKNELEIIKLTTEFVTLIQNEFYQSPKISNLSIFKNSIKDASFNLIDNVTFFEIKEDKYQKKIGTPI